MDSAVEKQLRPLLAVCAGHHDVIWLHEGQFLICAPGAGKQKAVPGRLKVFLDYLKLEQVTPIEEQVNAFAGQAEASPRWAQEYQL
jgi:hypothetical protein